MVFEVLLLIVLLLLYHSLSGKVRIVFTLKKKKIASWQLPQHWQAKIKESQNCEQESVFVLVMFCYKPTSMISRIQS